MSSKVVVITGASSGVGRAIAQAFEAQRASVALVARGIDGLEAGARVLDHKGRPFTEGDIGSALAMRDLMAGLRQSGEITGGPAPMTPRDRSRFLSKLDEAISALLRAHPRVPPPSGE